jgi:hypothetical protein
MVSRGTFWGIGANSPRIFNAQFGGEKNLGKKFVLLTQKKKQKLSRTSLLPSMVTQADWA